MSTVSEDPDSVADLRQARADVREARARVAEYGVDELESLRSAHEEFTALLRRYEEPATGDGDFQEFIEFQGKIESLVESLPEDLLLREVFEECDEYLQQRRLSESDFEHVRTQLQPVADLAARLQERSDAERRLEQAHSRARKRTRELAERIADLERLQRLGAADLDAPTERLHEPIEVYNDRVRSAFTEFRTEAPARDVLSLLADTDQFPLVGYEPPPPDLSRFINTAAIGTEPIHRLLEYADYSRSKLDHYVDDPARFTEAVGSQKTYLRRIDADPLTVSWPPPPAGELRLRTREYQAVCNRFDPEVVEALRPVRRLPRTTDYEHLRESAVASAELTTEQRERLRRGAVAEELEAARTARDRIEDALAAETDL